MTTRPFRKEAIACRMHGLASAVGWDLSITDLAKQVGHDARLVGRIAREKDWITRFRAGKTDIRRSAALDAPTHDGALDRIPDNWR